jgi:shikimate kinase
MQSETIVLVGPMGVGKTTVGRKLASALNLDFRDTDQLFVKLHGSISLFFELHGEAKFREIESQIVDEALDSAGVIATGGGVVLDAANRAKLESATVVYLSTDGTHMAKRLSQGKRPLIENGLSDWKRIYDQRRALYEEVSDLTFDCSGKPIKVTVEEIVEALRS